MTTREVLGLDIGGANVKAATSSGRGNSAFFPLWKHPEKLPGVLHETTRSFPACDAVAVTMTGELADCFETKRVGIDSILNAVENFAGTRKVFVWNMKNGFVSPEVARIQPAEIAAGNWHALATWCQQQRNSASPSDLAGTGVLIDIGSTTTDIIPLPASGGIAARTDVERLAQRELVYTGLRRTPLCAVASTIPWKGIDIPVAAEFFATMQDAFLLTGKLPEAIDDCDTANGKPATISAAQDRMARMLCCDREDCSLETAREWAAWFQEQQFQQLTRALRQRFLAPPGWAVVSGSGEFLARRLIESQPDWKHVTIIGLSEWISPEIAEAAPAYAVASLLAQSDLKWEGQPNRLPR